MKPALTKEIEIHLVHITNIADYNCYNINKNSTKMYLEQMTRKISKHYREPEGKLS